MERKEENLLTVLSEKVKCEYLSDLHSFYYRSQLISTLKEMEAEKYSVSEWREAAAYILNEPTTLNVQDKIKDYLIAVLEMKRLGI